MEQLVVAMLQLAFWTIVVWFGFLAILGVRSKRRRDAKAAMLSRYDVNIWS